MKAILRSMRPEHQPRTAPGHPVDEVLPASTLVVYGTQHVLAFYAARTRTPWSSRR